MIHDLKDPLPYQAGGEPVIDAGHGIEQDHGDTVDGGGDNGIRVSVQGGENDAKDGRRYGEGAPDDMGDHMKAFFRAGVGGEDAVF